MNAVTWSGSQQESWELVNAIARNCACTIDMLGTRIDTCASHGLLTNQRALDGLLMVKRTKILWWASEWMGEAPRG